MPQVKLDVDDAEAILNLVDVLVGRRSGGNCFADRGDRTRLAPFFSVAVSNVANILEEERRRQATKARAEPISHRSARR